LREFEALEKIARKGEKIDPGWRFERAAGAHPHSAN
jgi:hypothetical protein